MKRLAPAVAIALLVACSHREEQAPPAEPAAPPPAIAQDAFGVAETAAAGAATAKSALRAQAHGFVQPMIAPAHAPEQRETYAHVTGNPVQLVAESPVSTFSIDVDTGSYANVRRFLAGGTLPPQDAVRVEELLNYFDYGDPSPRDRGVPFSVVTEMAPSPWNAKTHLLRIGLRGWKPAGPRVPSNLVFLVDVSGSMQDADKLPLVKQALGLLAGTMTGADRISLVVYAGASGVVLEPTPGDRGDLIGAALERLEAGGSTNGGDGIRLAYAMAQRAYRAGANNRVLLATDGDFNVGTTSFEELVDLVEQKRRTGIALTTLGFGTGNYNDHLMEQLADAGNGNHAYIDGLEEARKALVEQRDATLTTIARDVKIQVEFNPAAVSEYRLIGYENRVLDRAAFSNDKVDAGDIGAGHAVTALYELTLAGSGGERVDPLRYGATPAPGKGADELAFLRLRYKRASDGMEAPSRLLERAVLRSAAHAGLAQASRGFRFAAAVAGFGQLLRGGAWTGDFQYTDVERLARGAVAGESRDLERGFLQLVAQAARLSQEHASAISEN